jgi:glycosyltransferase involved in cell wall biosynthesis
MSDSENISSFESNETDKILTISIAAYNMEKQLEHCLSSLVSEPDVNRLCQIIVVNDGSIDDTEGIANTFKEKYPNCIEVINQANGGYGSTVNKSLAIAKGKYFRLLDADDAFETSVLSSFLQELRSTDADIIFSPYSELHIATGATVMKNVFESNSRTDVLPFNRFKINNKAHYTMHSVTYKTKLLQKSGLHLLEHCLYTDNIYLTAPLKSVKTYQFLPYTLYKHYLGYSEQSMNSKQIRSHISDLQKVLNSEQQILASFSTVEIQDNKNAYLITQKTALGLCGLIANVILLPANSSIPSEMSLFLKQLQQVDPNLYQKFLKHRIDIRILMLSRFSLLPLYKRIKR